MRLLSSVLLICGLACGGHAKEQNVAREQPATDEQACLGKLKHNTFQQLIGHIVEHGKDAAPDDVLTGRLARLLDVKDGSRMRGVYVAGGVTTDYMDHSADLYLDRTDPAEPKLLAVFLYTNAMIRGFADEVHRFRVSPDGRLEKALRMPASRTEDNEVVGGSGKPAMLDPTDPETQYRFRHELNFWLRGMYRRVTEKDCGLPEGVQPPPERGK